jgi:hypothetical protein
MKTRALFFALLLTITPAMMYGQIGSMIKKGASRVLNSTAKAASKEAASQADSVAQVKANEVAESNQNNNASGQGTGEGQGQQGGGGGGMGLGAKLFSNEVTSKYKPEYNFGSRMYMQMEMYDKEQVTKMDYNVYYSANDPSAGIEMKTVASSEEGSVPVNTMMVMDGENRSFMMITDLNGAKLGIISQIPDDSTMKSMNQPAKPPKVTKTGNTKVIAGYKCDEYLFQEADKKEYSKMWLTKDEVLKINKNVWSKSGMAGAYGYPGFEGMVIMAWENYDDKNKLIAKSETKEINTNYPHSMSVAGTAFRQMDFAKMQSQQNKK